MQTQIMHFFFFKIRLHRRCLRLFSIRFVRMSSAKRNDQISACSFHMRECVAFHVQFFVAGWHVPAARSLSFDGGGSMHGMRLHSIYLTHNKCDIYNMQQRCIFLSTRFLHLTHCCLCVPVVVAIICYIVDRTICERIHFFCLVSPVISWKFPKRTQNYCCFISFISYMRHTGSRSRSREMKCH